MSTWLLAVGLSIAAWRGVIRPLRERRRIAKALRHLHPKALPPTAEDEATPHAPSTNTEPPQSTTPAHGELEAWQLLPTANGGWKKLTTFGVNHEFTIKLVKPAKPAKSASLSELSELSELDDICLSIYFPFYKRFAARYASHIPRDMQVSRVGHGLLAPKTFDKSFEVQSAEYGSTLIPDDRAKFIYMTPPIRKFFMTHPTLEIRRGALHIPWSGKADTQAEIAREVDRALALAREFFALWGSMNEGERLHHKLLHDPQPLLRMGALAYLVEERAEVGLRACRDALSDADPEVRLSAAVDLAGVYGQPEEAFDTLLVLLPSLTASWEQLELCLDALFYHYQLDAWRAALLTLLESAPTKLHKELSDHTIRSAAKHVEDPESLARDMLGIPHCALRPTLYKELSRWGKEPETLGLLKALLEAEEPPPAARLIKRAIGRIEPRIQKQQGGELTLITEASQAGQVSLTDKAEGMLSFTESQEAKTDESD